MFSKPTPVLGVAVALGANSSELEKLLPKYEDIPDEFKGFNMNKWEKLVSTWFFNGLPNTDMLVPKPGINKLLALAHVKAVLGSFAPKHEHKTAGCAYLLSLWFEELKD